MATLEQILNYRNLTGVIQSIKSGIPQPLPEAFYRVGRRVSGDKAEYFRITGSRQTARLAQYGSPSQLRDLRGLDNINVKLLHTIESQQWPLTLTINLSKMSELTKDDEGRQQAEYQSGEFKRLFANLRIAATLMTLFSGKIYVDKNGNILPTSTGSAYTIDSYVPSSNQGQLGGTISTKWSNTAANITTQLINLKNKASKTTGYEIEYAFYGDSVPEWIAANATAKEYLARNPQMQQQYLNTGLIPNGFGGIKNWVYAGNAFYQDNTGTNQSLLGASQVVFTPAPSPDWWDTFEGSYPVPTSVVPEVGADATTMLGRVSEVFGTFQYGLLTMDPPSVKQVAGDTFLPVLKVPAAIWQATVDF